MSSPSLIDRRHFLAMAGSSFAAMLAPRAAFALHRTDAVFATAFLDPAGGFGVATMSEQGEMIHQWPLPARGHDVVWHPDHTRLVAFARRPGTFAAVIRTDGSGEPVIFNTPAGRHFYGHGVFSADGKLLYATENDFDAARGVIGIYDATDAFQRIGEFDSGGVGPHDLLLLSDRRTLLVANGGVETHPDYPRVKLNIATMQPNLALIDSETGELKMSFAPPPDQHKLSIRHLALQADGTAWFACQNEGDVSQAVPLAGALTLDGDIAMLDLAAADWAPLRGYIGSIACTPDGERLALTSPHGGSVLEIDLLQKRVAQRITMDEVCGVAACGPNFILSSGTGRFGGGASALAFDNHISPGLTA